MSEPFRIAAIAAFDNDGNEVHREPLLYELLVFMWDEATITWHIRPGPHPDTPRAEVIDWRDILGRYIDHVAEIEGVDFRSMGPGEMFDASPAEQIAIEDLVGYPIWNTEDQ